MDDQKSRGYGLSLSKEVNMTNCYNHCKHFFHKCKKIHFNVLIAYWIMAGYLGRVDSVEEAYNKGFEILMDLVYEEKIIKPLDETEEKSDSNSNSKSKAWRHEFVEFAIPDSDSDPDPKPCRHEGFCVAENLAFVDLLVDSGAESLGSKDVVDLSELKNVVCTDGMVKTYPKKQQSMLLIDGDHLSRQVFHSHPLRSLQHLAYFNPRPNSITPLLKKVTPKVTPQLLKKVTPQLSVLILRECKLLAQSELWFNFLRFKSCTVLEISGSTHLTSIPQNTISEMTQLRCLNLSNLLIEKLPGDFFKSLVQLRWLILTRLSKLLSLPTIKPLINLEVLDVSHCTALYVLIANVISNPNLQILDLSHTDMLKIPPLKLTTKLTHLFLRDSKASVLNSLQQLTSLLVLDLSGSHKVKVVGPLKDNKNLVILDLSRTSIDSIAFLPDLSQLRNLLLQECTQLGELPALSNLKSLEVLDISGCVQLTTLPSDLSELRNLKDLSLSRCSDLLELKEGLFDQMSCLQTLDLSLLNVNHLPSFAKLTTLCKLFLRGLHLDSLEIPASLSNLIQLDLEGLKISSEFPFDFIQTLEKLQSLNLSQTSVAKLPSLSKLISLKELILADCQHLQIVPDLQTLTNLVALDLSFTSCSIDNCKVETEGQAGFYSCLRKLVLTNRYGVLKLFPQTSLGNMDKLDLRGTDVSEIPYEVMAQVKCIQLLATVDLSGLGLHRMGHPQELIDWNDNPQDGHLQGRISKSLEITIAFADGSKSTLSAGPNQFFHLKEGNQGSWEALFRKFSVFLPPKGSKDKLMHLDGDEFILKDDLSWARRLINLEMKDASGYIWYDKKGRSVEIHGFSELAEIQNESIQTTLKEADNLAFVGNDFFCTLSDVCSKDMEACCIRRCLKVKSVLTIVTDEGNEKVTRCPKRLVLSHLVDLEFICDENVSSENIKSLQHIHIDCCPKLTKLIVASQVPQNLKSLHIKFCDRLQTLFEDNICLLQFQCLNVFDLPILESIEADLPKLQSLSIGQCPKLKNLDRVLKSASTSLTQLCLESCPSLEHVFPSLPVLPHLNVLKIRSCSKLVTLFSKLEGIDASFPELQILSISQCLNLKNLDGVIKSASASLTQLTLESSPCLEQVLPSLPVLQKLKVLKISSCNGLVTLLDNLEGINADLPELQSLSISRFPKLKNLDRVIKSASTSLTKLFLDSCPYLEHVLPSLPVLQNLEVLKISSCSGLVTLSDKLESIEADLPKLQTLSISQCLKLKDLNGVIKHATTSLTDLNLESCPCLEHVFPSSSVLPNLNVLKIRSCGGLVTLYDNMEGIEAGLPELHTLSISQCPKLKNLDGVVNSGNTSLTQLCLDSCPCLEHVLPCSPVLPNLKVLKISSCSGLVTLFEKAASSSSPSHRLEDLQTLRLWNLPKLKGVGGEISLVTTPELDPSLPPSIKQHLTYPSKENFEM